MALHTIQWASARDVGEYDLSDIENSISLADMAKKRRFWIQSDIKRRVFNITDKLN